MLERAKKEVAYGHYENVSHLFREGARRIFIEID
jgi:hypothetical protein